jgi:hypothetical protein
MRISMNFNVEKRYFWKELTAGGMLKDPADIGPFYTSESVNDPNGYGSESEAIIRLTNLKKKWGGICPTKLTLYTEYRLISK